MSFIADFHIHSRYSRATSSQCIPEKLEYWASLKGIDVQGTGDFTHAAWRSELREKLVKCDDGLYVLKKEYRDLSVSSLRKVKFIVSGEISSIYKKNGRTRKVHNLIVLPDLESADILSKKLEAIGNLHSDGRPILGLDSKNLLEITLEACPEALFIPAHIWTPHFSVFGANSGFDDIEECYEDLTKHIFALETGLSSDPPMNWRLSALDRFALVSNSDAHSPANLAREANIFDTDTTYTAIYNALKTNDRKAFKGTIEFFPEEGKYHFDGHRACKVQWEPSQTIKASGICPVCGGKLTIGVLNRVEQLADRAEDYVPPDARQYERIVPLANIISACIGSPAVSTRVSVIYMKMIEKLGPELFILRKAEINDIQKAAGALLAEGISRVRSGRLDISAGYDGEYGKVEIFTPKQLDEFTGQANLFGSCADFTIKKKNKNCENKKRAPQKKTAAGKKSGELNEQQAGAVSYQGKSLIVIAGPGTGKTHTLVSRIAFLVNRQDADPETITAVTFTNKAASEMRTRLRASLQDKNGKMPFVGTFHSLCLDMLKDFFPEKRRTIIDQGTATSIISEIIDKNKYGLKISDVMRVISCAKAEGKKDIDCLDSNMLSVYNSYNEKLKEYDAMDFDDILLAVLESFKDNNIVFAKAAGRFRHILIDEFQDINRIQYSLVKLWAESGGSVFAIGDPNQAIYGFRGASPEYFNEFSRDLKGMRTIVLNKNYRSPVSVVNAAGSLISHTATSTFHYTDEIKAESHNTRLVRLVECADEFYEALFMAKEINMMVGGIDMLDTQSFIDKKSHGHSYDYGFSDIAVIYRTHRQAGIIEQCLIKEGIPYRIAGRDDFLTDDSVCHVLSLLRYIINKDDILSLVSCLNNINRENSSIIKKYSQGIHSIEALQDILIHSSPDSDLQQKYMYFTDILKRFSSKADTCNALTFIKELTEEIKLEKNPSVEKLMDIAELHFDIRSLVYGITLGQDADIVRNGHKTVTPDAVMLTTMHAAKGLEFPVVFLCGVNDGLIPFHKSNCEPDNPDEERRLFYVGITRAKDELICSYTKRRSINGVTGETKISSFVNDMGEKNYRKEIFRPEQNVRQMSFL
jgi:uncharacterized protein (TIGR00375 family)